MRIRPNSNHHPRQILLVIGFLLGNLQYILTTIFFSGEILLVKELKIVDALEKLNFGGFSLVSSEHSKMHDHASIVSLSCLV